MDCNPICVDTLHNVDDVISKGIFSPELTFWSSPHPCRNPNVPIEFFSFWDSCWRQWGGSKSWISENRCCLQSAEVLKPKLGGRNYLFVPQLPASTNQPLVSWEFWELQSRERESSSWFCWKATDNVQLIHDSVFAMSQMRWLMFFLDNHCWLIVGEPLD